MMCFLKTKKIMKNCIIFLSHIINDDIANRFLKIKNDVKNNYDLYFVFDSSSNYYEKTKEYSDKINFVFINQHDLDILGYKHLCDNSCFGVEYWYVLYFNKILNYHYDNYWLMEYDVFFNGDYNDFFTDIDNNLHEDFITHSIYTYYDDEDWYWWQTQFTLTAEFYNNDKNNLLKSFNPIYRISNRCIDFLDKFLKENQISGYFEYLLITLLYNNGFSIFSINNTDKSLHFTNDKYNKKYSNDETFRYRPSITSKDIEEYGENMFYHPLK